MAARIVQPKVIMPGGSRPRSRGRCTEKADDNPFFKPFTKFPASIAPEEQERLKAEARAAIKASDRTCLP